VALTARVCVGHWSHFFTGLGMSEEFLGGNRTIQRRTVRNAAKKSQPRRGGRLTEERRREIVALVAPLFLEHGYEQVSIDDIVDRVGGSKRTLYDHFGGKAGLFETVISEYCASVQRDLFAAVDQNASVEKQLTAIGKHFLGNILHRRIRELHRLMVSMGRSFPSVASLFYQLGPISAYGLVAGWMERQQKEGKLGPGDPTTLAELFLDMLTGKHQLALLTSSVESTSPEEIEHTVKAAVKLFLNGARRSG
jgi:TetR/AcrR family transcriptional regulator, mexJK operon transcriptional repressor